MWHLHTPVNLCVQYSSPYTWNQITLFPPSLGGYGYVFVAQDSETGKDYALKVKQEVSSDP